MDSRAEAGLPPKGREKVDANTWHVLEGEQVVGTIKREGRRFPVRALTPHGEVAWTPVGYRTLREAEEAIRVINRGEATRILDDQIEYGRTGA